MSRRQYTTLILQVRIPVPAGKTQAQTVEWAKGRLTLPIDNLREERGVVGEDGFSSSQTQVKLTGKETHYL